MSRPIASLSLDLDNKWSYMKTHGDADWDQFPGYLDLVVPRVLDMLSARDLKITFFVVGQDAALPENRAVLRTLADAGHEIGNHSFNHEPWLHRYSEAALDEELTRAEQHITDATGQHPVGFRGPGFSLSPGVLRQLIDRGYQYDASTFPTFIGPLARAYYFRSAKLSAEERRDRAYLFGRFRDGFQPLKPYRWTHGDDAPRTILEIPVTTLPILRSPIHISYLLYLDQVSPRLARFYFAAALRTCRLTGVAPSILLHPLDFLGCEDGTGLEFFPAMGVPSARKLALMDDVLDMMTRHFEVVTMREHAARQGDVKRRRRVGDEPQPEPSTRAAGAQSGSTDHANA